MQLAIKLKTDRQAYARACLTIRDKNKIARRLVFNRAQQHIHAQLEAQKNATGKVRALILKGTAAGLLNVCRRQVLSPGDARAGRQGLHPHAPRHGHAEPVRHRQALSRQLPRMVAAIDRQRQRQGAVLQQTRQRLQGWHRRHEGHRSLEPRFRYFTVPNVAFWPHADDSHCRRAAGGARCAGKRDHPRKHGQRRRWHIPQHVARCETARERVYRDLRPLVLAGRISPDVPAGFALDEEEQTYARLYELSLERWRGGASRSPS